MLRHIGILFAAILVSSCNSSSAQIQAGQPADLTNESVAASAPQDDPAWIDTVSTESRLGEKMIGGSTTRPGDWPFFAALRGEMANGHLAHFCGGTAISSQWILTAAHCVDKLTRRDDGAWTDRTYGVVSVVIGVRNLPDTPAANVFQVLNVLKRDDYVAADPARGVTAQNDIALVQIKGSWKGPVARLSASSDSDNDWTFGRGFTAGFGVTRPGGMLYPFQYAAGGKRGYAGSPQLLHAILPMWSPEECEKLLGGGSYQLQTQICAGYEAGGIDSCDADSGGPLAGLNDQDRVYQIGVVSYGIRCATPNSPSIYTRVSAFAGWIKTRVPDTKFVNARPETAIAASQETLKAIVNLLAPTPTRLSIEIKPSPALTEGEKNSRIVVTSAVAGRLWVLNIGPAGEITALYPYPKMDPDKLLVKAGQTISLPDSTNADQTVFRNNNSVRVEHNEVVAFILPPSVAIVGDGIPALNKGTPTERKVDYGARLRNQIVRALDSSGSEAWASGRASYTITGP